MQLELPIKDLNPIELKFEFVEKRVDNIECSLGKVRRSLFAEIGSLKKLIYKLTEENQELKRQYAELAGSKYEWIYGQEENLFIAREA